MTDGTVPGTAARRFLHPPPCGEGNREARPRLAPRCRHACAQQQHASAAGVDVLPAMEFGIRGGETHARLLPTISAALLPVPAGRPGDAGGTRDATRRLADEAARSPRLRPA